MESLPTPKKLNKLALEVMEKEPRHDGERHRLHGIFPDGSPVYIYIDYPLSCPEQGPIYVGVGSAPRVKAVGKLANPWHTQTKDKHGLLRIFYAVGSWENACIAEAALIAKLRTGGAKLCNVSDSGAGIAVQKKLSDSVKAAWKDPKVRAAMSEAMKSGWAKPEVREKQSAALKAFHARPEVRARIKAVFADPEVKARMSISAKQANSRPEVKEKRVTSVKLMWATRKLYLKMSGYTGDPRAINVKQARDWLAVNAPEALAKLEAA